MIWCWFLPQTFYNINILLSPTVKQKKLLDYMMKYNKDVTEKKWRKTSSSLFTKNHNLHAKIQSIKI